MNSFPPELAIGMDVFDATGAHIGTVDDLRFPENATAPEVTPSDLDATDRGQVGGLLESIASAFADDPVPGPLRDRLLVSGFLRLHADGFMAADRFITPDQIARVDATGVRLAVTRDALLRRP